MNDRKRMILTIVAIFLVGLVITGGSYAYFSWAGGVNKNIIFNTAGDLKDYIVYDEGESKFVGNLQVGDDYTDGIHSTIALKKTDDAANISLIATIHLDVNQIGTNMKKSPALKWTVTERTSGNTELELASGNFVGSNAGDTLTLVPNINVTTSKVYYTIWIWLDEDENPSELLSGETLDTNVWTEINQLEGTEDRFEVTRISANYQTISATVVDSKYKVTHYKVTESNTVPNSWTEITPASDKNNVYNLTSTDNTRTVNTTYYVWFKDENNRTTYKSVTITAVDTTEPDCSWGTWNVTSIANNETASINLTCTDESEITNSNLTASSFELSNNKVTITNVTKTSVTGGYKYTVTVKGTTSDGETTLTLPANTIKNVLYPTVQGNEVKTSAAITVANTYAVEFETANNNCALNATTYADRTETYGTAWTIANPSCTGYTFAGWTASNTLDTTNAKYGDSSSAVTTTWSNASTATKATYFKDLALRSNRTITLTATWTANELTFSNQTLDSGVYGTAYTSNAFTGASNGSNDYTYTIVSGAPTGATISGTNRTISFTNSTNAGTYNVIVKAKDNVTNAEKQATMTITIERLEITFPTCTSQAYTAEEQTLFAAHDSGQYTNSVIKGTNVDSYTGDLTPTANYKWSSGSNVTSARTLTCYITKANTTTTLGNQNKTYNGESQAASGATAKLNSNNANIAGAAFTYKYYTNNECSTGETSTAPTNYGTYYVKATLTGTDNYNSSTSDCKTYTMNKKEITITAKDQTINYGSSIATGTSQVTVATLVTGDTLDSVTLTPSTANYTTNGTITPSAAVIKRSGTAVTSNYDIEYVAGVLKINKVNATCPSLTSYNAAYDGNKHSITVGNNSSGGTVQYRTASNGEWSNTNPELGPNAGTDTTVYVQVLGDSNHNTVQCYVTGTTNAKVTITQKALTSTQIDAWSTTWVSGASTYARNNVSTGVGTEKINLTYTPKVNAVGTYAYSATAADNKYTLSLSSNNYSVSSAGDFTLTGATITGSVTISGTATWGETLTANASCTTPSSGCTFDNYQWKADGVDISGATSSTYTIPKEKVGQVISVSVRAKATNYANKTLTSSGTDAVAKQNLSVTTTNYNAAYDGNTHYATINVTSSAWNGSTIVSGTSTSYGTNVTTSGVVNTSYNLKPGYSDFTDGTKTVYYKVTGGTYYNDKTGSATVTITKASMSGGSVSIGGNKIYGSILTATISDTTPAADSYTCTWYSNTSQSNSGGTQITSGEATNKQCTYTIGTGLIGKYIYVEITASKSNYSNRTFKSDATSAIAQREVEVTAPTMASGTLTYSGSEQTITGNAGSCSAGGTMYYYTTNYTTSTAPSFSTSTWTTTFPSSAKGTNARTYYLWYYCYVSDTTNNKAKSGSSINTALSVTKAIGKYTPSIAISPNTGTVNYNNSTTFTATPTTISSCQGTLTAASADTTKVSITGGASNSNVANDTGKTITWKGVGYTTDTKINVNYAPSDTNNCNSATQVQYTAVVNKVVATCPTTFNGYSGTYDGSSHTVTVSGQSGGTIKYSTDNATWGDDLPTRTAVGTTTVYVKMVGDSNHTNNNSCGSKQIVINQRTVTITAPTVNSTTLTYNGSGQNLLATAGSCSTGGTMYWYSSNPTTSNSAPTFSTSTWTTTSPTNTSYKGTNAGTYYIWYYCKVDDTTNNTGTNINTRLNVTKEIQTKGITGSVSISGTSTWGQTLTATGTCSDPSSGCSFSNYKWYYTTSDSPTGGTQIDGATSSTYEIDKSLVGKYIYVTVDASATNYTTRTLTSTTTTPAIAKQSLSVTRTNYTGDYDTSAHGVVVKVDSSAWNGKTIVSGTTTSYGTTVTSNGAYNTNYTLSPTYTNVTGETKTVYYKITGGDYYSDYTGSGTVNIANADMSGGSVAISGTNTWGQKLTATINNTTPTATYKCSWYYTTTSGATSSGTAIDGATNQTPSSNKCEYTIDKSLVGKYIYVVVTASKTNYNPVTFADATDATANTTAAVAKQNLSVTTTNYNNAYDNSTHYATITVTSSEWTGKTIVSGTSTSYGTNVTTSGAVNTSYNLQPGYTNFTDGAKTVYYKVTGGTYYKDKTGSATVNITKATCNAPTNVAISSAGIVTWTASSNASSYEISLSSDSGFASATSGVNYRSTLVASAGAKTVYVRSVCDSTNYTTPSANATASIDVYTVSLSNGIGVSATTGGGRYISGETVTLGATVMSGYTWSNWTQTTGGAQVSTTQAYSAAITGNWSYTANATGNTYTATFYYNSNATNGSKTVASTTKSCTVSNNAGNCSIDIPTAVTGSVGTWNNAYAGLSTSVGNMTQAVASNASSITLSGNTTYYSIYRTAVTVYRPSATNTCTTQQYYRNEWFTSTSAIADPVLSTSTTGTSSSNPTVVSGYNYDNSYAKKVTTSASLGGTAYSSFGEAAKSNTTTFYASSKKTVSVTGTFYYQSNATSGSTTISSKTKSEDTTQTLYCTSTSAATTSNASVSVAIPSEVTSSVGTYNNAYAGLSASTGNMTEAAASNATSVSINSDKTYYAIYRKSLTNYYYNNNSYTSRTLYRNQWFTSTSAMADPVLSTSSTGTSNYSTATGPGSSAWAGLSTAADTTAEYASVTNAAKSNSGNLYTVYQFNVTYSIGSNVSSIGDTSGSCKVSATGASAGGTSCTVTLPSISPNTGYTSVGWNTTSGATTGTAGGNTYTLSSSGGTLYANAVDVTAPTGSVSASANINVITATASVSDNGSGLGSPATYYWKVSTSATCDSTVTGFVDTTTNSYSYTSSDIGVNYVCLKISDVAGNTAYFSTSAIYLHASILSYDNTETEVDCDTAQCMIDTIDCILDGGTWTGSSCYR